MAVKATVTRAGTSSPHTECNCGSAGQLTSVFLAAFLLLASLLIIREVTRIPRASSDAAHASKTIQTVREFYAALNEYVETGDDSAVLQVLAPGALAFVPEQGLFGTDSGLSTYLLALRAALPQILFTVDHIDAADDLAFASVRVSGTAGTPAHGWPQASGTSHEFFRVRDRRIVEHWTTAPGSALLLPLTKPPMHVELIQPGHLAIAELSFPPGRLDSQSIEGPALVIVESGRLTLTGNGSSQILDIETDAAFVPGQNEHVSIARGQAISIPDDRAFVRNNSSDVADALVATLVDDPRQALETVQGQRQPPPPSLNDAALIGAQSATTYGGVTVLPLAFDDHSIPVGSWELEIAWVVLGPGTSLPVASDWSLAHVMSGSASTLTQSQNTLSEQRPALTNTGDLPVAALVILLRPSG